MRAGRRGGRPRIAWVVPGFQDGADEPGIPALSLLAEALGRYCDLHIYAVRFPERAAAYRLGSATVRSFGYPDNPAESPARRRVRSARRWASALAAIAADHRRAPYALVHGFWASEPGMLAVVAGRLLGLPSLVSVAGGEVAAVRPAGYGGRLRPTERCQIAMTLHLATAIGVGSADARQRILLRYPWLRGRIRTLPLGFSPTIFGLLPPRPRLGRLVCVASWAPVKGHTLLFEAARLLIDRGVPLELVLIGERTDSPETCAAVAAWDLGAHSRLLGAVAQTVVAAELQHAAVAVIASWHEAQCLAAIEALACGVPLVSTRTGIARELLGQRAVGSLVASRTPAVLAEALGSYLCRPPDGPEDLALRRAAAATYVQPKVTERFLATYDALVR